MCQNLASLINSNMFASCNRLHSKGWNMVKHTAGVASVRFVVALVLYLAANE